MFSVETEAEAKALIVLTCPINLCHQYYAPELVEAQTIENLEKFGNRLAKAYKLIKGTV